MDSRGNLYMDSATAEAFALKAADHRPLAETPKDALAIDSKSVASQLARLNRKARLAFYSARRRGESEWDALAAAEGTLL